MATCPCCKQPLPVKPKPKQQCPRFDDSVTSLSFSEGKAVGLSWDASWMPGGPYVYPRQPASQAKREAWLAGFAEGLETLLRSNAKFRRWWETNKGNSPSRDGMNIKQLRWNHRDNIPGFEPHIPPADGLPNSAIGDWQRDQRKRHGR